MVFFNESTLLGGVVEAAKSLRSFLVCKCRNHFDDAGITNTKLLRVLKLYHR